MSKKLMFLAITMLIVFGFWGCQKQINIEAEEEAIKEILKKQDEIMQSRNFENYQEIWAHEPYVVRMMNDGERSTGWNNLGQMYKDYMEENPEPPKDRKVEFTDFHIKIYGNVAWGINTMKTGRIRQGEFSISDSWHVRFLEKRNGEWKVVFYINGPIKKEE